MKKDLIKNAWNLFLILMNPKRLSFYGMPTAYPKTSKWNLFQWWACFLTRHYFGKNLLIKRQKKVEDKILKDYKRHGKPKGYITPPRFKASEINSEKFKEIAIKTNSPVIIEGFAKDWDCTKKWSPQFLKENYKDEIVPVRRESDRLDSEGYIYVNRTLSELVDNIEKGGVLQGTLLENIFNNNPELREDLNIPKIEEYCCLTKRQELQSTQLFITGKNGRTGLHCASGINFFINVYGHKKWTFVHPHHTIGCYPDVREDMFYSNSALDYWKSDEELEKEGYTLWPYIPKYKFTLSPGDVVLSPQWWWHAVDNKDTTIAVANRTFNKLLMGNKVFAFLNFFSPTSLRCYFRFLKTGWGSDDSIIEVCEHNGREAVEKGN